MIKVLDSLFFGLRKFFVQKLIQLNSGKRIQIYRDLVSHVSATDIDDALTTLQKEAEQLGGNEILMYEEIQLSLQNQKSFYVGISEWIPRNEALQIYVAKQGKGTDSLPKSIDAAREICEQKSKLSSMYIQKMAYPVIMLIIAIGIMMFFKIYVYEFLTGIKSFEKWEIHTQRDFLAIAYYADNIYWIVALVVGAIMAIVYFMLHGKGALRASVNRIPPFSIYQSITSYTILISLASLTGSGVQIAEALRLIRSSFSGWAEEELGKIIERMEKPGTLPEGQTLTEFAFNSPIFTKLVRVKVGSYARRKGFIENLNYLNTVLINDVSKETLRSSAILSALVLFAVVGIVVQLAIIFFSVLLSK